MNQFCINGKSHDVPLAPETRFEALLSYVNKTWVNPTSLLSEIRINGLPINALEEQSLSHVPLSRLETVEVTLIHPRELVEETLQTLKLFTERLAQIAATPHASQHKIIEGLETLTESVKTIHQILEMPASPLITRLESELLATLKDAEKEGFSSTVRDRLACNLKQWSDAGLPELIRSRDS